MEFVGQPGPSGACSLLGVPGLSTFDVDDDEGEAVIGIRPKSSPLPRRKSSVSDEDSEPEPLLCGSRRVSFADAKGLSLVQVKEFDTWDVPKLPGYESSEGEGKDKEEYLLSPLTFFPFCAEELLAKVQEEKVVLETIELLPGTTILKGVIRVLNISFNKSVFIRTTLDTWTSHFDLLAEYIPGSSDNLTDCFSFKLTLVPPFTAQGARVDFCLRYETPLGTFWANNNNKNYVLFCQKRVKERQEKEEMENANKKSCLKTVGQNFSTVENISAMEDSSGENMSTDASTNGGQADAMTTKQISDGQSGTSAEKAQQVAESRQNCSRKKRRKAARMARVRDFFAQQGGAANDDERDASPPEEKPASQEETPDEKHTGVQPVSEGGNKSEGSLCVSESLETSCEPTIDVPQDAAKAHDYTSNNEPEKSESMNADDSTLPGGERAADNIRDSPVYSNDDSAEWRNVDRPVSTAEEGSQEQGVSFECPSSIAAELADSVISAVSRESLVNNINSFTFGTVVAPMYHQVSGRVGGETQSAETRAENYPHADRKETNCIAPADAGGNNDNVQGNVIKAQESQESCLHAANSPPSEEETSLSVTTDGILDCAETHDPVMLSNQRCTDTSEDVKGISDGHLNAVNILNTDLLDPQIHTESFHLRGEEQEDNLTRDLRNQSTVETAQAETPERTSTQAQSHLDETHPQNQTEEVRRSLEASFVSLQPSERALERFSDDTEQQTSGDATNDGKCVPQISLETYEETNDGEEENKEPIISNCYIRVDMFMELNDDDDFKYEDIFVSEKIEMDSRLADAAEVKNWEMMVEEEEENILTDEEENEAMSSKAENTEAAEKDQGRRSEDAGIEAAPENKSTTEAEEEKADDGDASAEDKQIGEIVAGKNSDESEKEFEYVEATEMEKTAGVEELADEKEQVEIELEKEKHFAEMQEVGIQTTEVQEEEEIVGEEEIDMNNDDESDQVEPREKNVEEENPDYKEGILVDETSMIADAESESMTIVYRESEVGGFGARLDITQNKVEDGLSAPLNNVQDEGLCEKIRESNETHLRQEETFQSGQNDTHDESESAVADRGSCIFADQPERDQLSDGSEAAESDSDDEVELYMHCLRAVHVGAKAQKDRSKDTGFSGGKSAGFSGSRSKLLSTPMPSISESLDEEQTLSCLQDNHEDTEIADIQITAAPLLASSEHERVNRNVSWWTETLSCSNISKTLLYATVLVLFVVVAYYYDFIACFGLYVISLIWLCCQGERQPVKNNRMGRFQ